MLEFWLYSSYTSTCDAICGMLPLVKPRRITTTKKERKKIGTNFLLIDRLWLPSKLNASPEVSLMKDSFFFFIIS